jgi:prevent-host-death family protein
MIVNATELKNRLGKYLDASAKEPVTIEKSGRKVAVILSYDEYEHLQKIDDQLWGMAAIEAQKDGMESNGWQVLLDMAKEKGIDPNIPN